MLLSIKREMMSIDMNENDRFFATKKAAEILGVAHDTMIRYAHKYEVGRQLGGRKTAWVFTLEDLQTVWEKRMNGKRSVRIDIRDKEDLSALGVSPLFSDYRAFLNQFRSNV